MTKFKIIKSKKQAEKEGTETFTATDLALRYPKQYIEEMDKQRANESTAYTKHNDAVVKIFYLVDALLQQLDNCLDENYFKQTLKAKANSFVKELEAYNTRIYSTSETGKMRVGEMVQEQEEMHNIVFNISNIYYTELLDLLKKYENGHSTEEINKQILDSQYAMFKEYKLPEIVKKQILRIEPDAEKFNIRHLLEIVTREKVVKLKQLNPETLEVLDKIAKNCQIVW